MARLPPFYPLLPRSSALEVLQVLLWVRYGRSDPYTDPSLSREFRFNGPDRIRLSPSAIIIDMLASNNQPITSVHSFSINRVCDLSSCTF